MVKKQIYTSCATARGYEVAISNYGGAICAIMVPDKDGNVANEVIQGHGSIKQLTSGQGALPVNTYRTLGNRICKGQFMLNGKEISTGT